MEDLTISVLWWRAETPKLHLVSVEGRTEHQVLGRLEESEEHSSNKFIKL